MRSAKSLISGFGVAVSLVGAIACAFFITAALVAFHGSFAISGGEDPQSTLLTAGVKHERPIVIAAVPQPVTTRPAVGPIGGPVKQQPTAAAAAPKQAGAPVGAIRQPATVPLTPPPAPSNPVPGAPSATAPLANATAGLTTAVGTVVADATNSLGTTVAPISPALGGTVQGLGTGLASGVVSLGNTVAGVVDSLGTHPAAPQG